MKISTWSIIYSMLGIFYGIGFIFIPVPIATIYGLTLDYSGTILTRYYGSVLLENGIVFWFLRNEPLDSTIWPVFLISTFIYNCIHIAITIQAFLNKEANALIVGIIVLDLMLLFFSIYLFLKRYYRL